MTGKKKIRFCKQVIDVYNSLISGNDFNYMQRLKCMRGLRTGIQLATNFTNCFILRNYTYEIQAYFIVDLVSFVYPSYTAKVPYV